MQKNLWKKMSSLLIGTVLTACLLLTGCTSDTPAPSSSSPSASQSSSEAVSSSVSSTDVAVLGEGKTQFQFSVTDNEKNQKHYEIHTNQQTVGAALMELDLIAGEEGPYGLYVTTVNGITLDFEKDGSYWAFYVNGEYASSGVDATPVTPCAAYSLQAES